MLDAANLAAPQQRAIRQPQVGAQSEAAMRKSAKDFEAQALGFLLQPMFATVDMSKSSFGGGAAEAQLALAHGGAHAAPQPLARPVEALARHGDDVLAQG